MAVGTVTKYNGMEKTLFATANRQWDDSAAGNVMFCLCSNAYTPAATHTVTSSLAGIITAGDGAPISATSLTINNTAVPGSTFFASADVDFGSVVTITAKYLICVQPVTAGTFSATTSVLLWYLDLDTTSSSTTVSSSAASFKIIMPVNGWFKTL